MLLHREAQVAAGGGRGPPNLPLPTRTGLCRSVLATGMEVDPFLNQTSSPLRPDRWSSVGHASAVLGRNDKVPKRHRRQWRPIPGNTILPPPVTADVRAVSTYGPAAMLRGVCGHPARGFLLLCSRRLPLRRFGGSPLRHPLHVAPAQDGTPFEKILAQTQVMVSEDRSVNSLAARF